jgi:choline dehydrogenase-like flavoprotein
VIVELEAARTILRRPKVAVLGAGAVGILLSVALARRGIEVVLCEAGGRTAERESLAFNEAVIAGRQHRGITEGRARQIGGTTTLWGGQLISFRDIDFRPRPWLGLTGWPISRDAIVPYYEAASKMLGLQLLSDDDAMVWNTLRSARPHFGPDIEFVLTRWLKEPNLARLFRDDLTNNPKLTVLLHAPAVGFLPSDDGRTMSAVELRSRGGKTIALEAEHFVVATGTIEASRLMLAFARNRPELPWAGNAHVGSAFQDHLDVRAAEVIRIDKKRFSDTFDNIFLNGFKYNPKVVLASNVQEAERITNVAGVFDFDSSVGEHLAHLKILLRALRNGAKPPNLASMPMHLAALAKIWWPLIVRYLKDHRIFNPADLGIKLRLHCEQKPLAASRITLDKHKRDGHGMPLAVLDWQIDGVEVEAMAVFCERLARELEGQGLARLKVDPRIVSRDPAVLAEACDTNHHCGGLQMGISAADGVVDPDCRVHGTANLHIASAAVFPSSSFANPTFTAMALALRLADRIAPST